MIIILGHGSRREANKVAELLKGEDNKVIVACSDADKITCIVREEVPKVNLQSILDAYNMDELEYGLFEDLEGFFLYLLIKQLMSAMREGVRYIPCTGKQYHWNTWYRLLSPI